MPLLKSRKSVTSTTNRAAFIARFCNDSKIGLSKSDGAVIVNAFLETLENMLKENGSVQFSGFGTFSVSDRASRVGFNPRTGKKIDVPACKVISFKAGKRLKTSINDSANNVAE